MRRGFRADGRPVECPDCGCRDVDQFYERTDKPGIFTTRCRPCHHRRKNRNRVRKEYGLTLEEYESIMERPCSICGAESEELDHCHETGKVRGPLCRLCNTGLGRFKDSVSLVHAALGYLLHHSSARD